MTDAERQILANQVAIMNAIACITAVDPDWIDLLRQRVNETNEALRPTGRR